jgi:hypothetical protein
MRGRRSLFILLVVTAAGLAVGLAFATKASTTTGPNAQLASQDRVYGGGTYQPNTMVAPRNFAIDAHASGAAAYGDIEYATPSTIREEQITCLSVSGSKATIGGIITQATDPTLAGFWFMWVVQDNGSPISGTPDTAPFQDLGPAGDPAWPTGFPYVCPSPDTAISTVGFQLVPLLGGDVVIQQAGQ